MSWVGREGFGDDCWVCMRKGERDKGEGKKGVRVKW